jgi:DnaJ-class molecular chaperone|tara:strand:+ start:27 stop:233 length:207 start_codon:yes stop_codon:yes gene_type:complete
MVKLKLSQVKKVTCDDCHGNGYIRIATGDTSEDFRKNSEVHQCWSCDSEGELYETVKEKVVKHNEPIN